MFLTRILKTRELKSRPLPYEAPVPKRSGRGEAEQPVSASSHRRLVPCSDATSFLTWIEETISGVLGTEPSMHSLDRALLLLQKEYLFRRQGAVLCQDPPEGRVGFLCLSEVYHQKATELYEMQLQLLRSMSFTPDMSEQAAKPQEPEEPVQELFIGEELDEDE